MPFPLEEKYITETEEKLNVIFPSSFKEKMMKENGGEIEIEDDDWQLIPFLDASDKKRLSRTCNDIVRETNEGRKWPNFSSDFIAIGANGSGDLLIFKREKSSNPKLEEIVYCWFHETGEIEPVADNFSDLIVNNL